MKIEMLRTVPGSPHGHDGFTYRKGSVYSAETEPPMTAALAEVFVREKWAVEVDCKALGAAPENKALAPGRPTKGRRRRTKSTRHER